MAAALSAGLLSGCGGSDELAAGGRADEDASVDERRGGLPGPAASGPTTDCGPTSPAASAPTLPAIEEAWVCQYAANEANEWLLDRRGPPGGRQGSCRTSRPAWANSRLPRPTRCVRRTSGRAGCSSTATADGDLTGVVVDDFGCRSVRLTDEPFETVPGKAPPAGIAAGLLASPDGLLDQIKAAGA